MNFKMFAVRVYQLLKPWNLFAIVKAYALCLRYKRRYAGLKNHFLFWLFTWSNLLVKYRDLRPEHFKVNSIEQGYDLDGVWRYIDYTDPTLVGGRSESGVKVALQYKATQEALRSLKASISTKKYSLDEFRKRAEKLKKAA